MNDVVLYIKEQIRYFPIAQNLSKYNRKSNNLQNKLGRLWEILDPLVQLGINYLIFGILMHRVVPNFPALPWMFIGMGAYGFAQNIIVGGSKQIASQFSTASKMKFPVSILPTSAALGYLPDFYVMMGAGALFAVANGYHPSIYWFQLIYYFIALVVFALAFSLLNSSIALIFPDYKYLLSYIFRILMYASGSVISLTQFKQIPESILRIQILNPFYYINEGFRDAIFSDKWFWQNGMFNLSFWTITVLLLIVAANMHMKIRDRISDYL